MHEAPVIGARMKYFFLVAVLLSAQAYAVLPSSVRNLPLKDQRILNLAQKLTESQKAEQNPSGPVQNTLEGQAVTKLVAAMMAEPLFQPVALSICSSKLASPAVQKTEPLDATKMEDVARFEASMKLLSSIKTAAIPGAERLTEAQFTLLYMEVYTRTAYEATIGCVVQFSQQSALKAQREGKVSNFLSDFDGQIVQAANKIVADWKKADSKAVETFDAQTDKILEAMIRKIEEELDKVPGQNNPQQKPPPIRRGNFGGMRG